MRHIIWLTQEKNRPLYFRIWWNVKSKTWICHILCPAVSFIHFYTKCKTEKATLDFCMVWNLEAVYWNFSLSTNSKIRMIHINWMYRLFQSLELWMFTYCDFSLSFYCIISDKKVFRVFIKPAKIWKKL